MNERPMPSVLYSWLTVVAVIALPITGLVLWLAGRFLPTLLLPVLLVWGGVLLWVVGVYLPLRRRSLAFCLTENQLTVTGGVLFITTRQMHTHAVRQITLLQGPLERRMGIAYLLVSATGGHLMVEGLSTEQAKDWCQRLQPQ